MKQKLLITLMALLLPIAASAYDVCINGIYYNIVKKAKQATVTYGDNKNGTYSGDVVIPETVVYDGVTCDVIEIGEYAFAGCTLSSLTIPSSVIKISAPSVYYNNTETEFAKSIGSLYISDVAVWCAIEFTNVKASPIHFANTWYVNNKVITELVIPDGVTAIRDYAFYGAKALTSVKISDSVGSIGAGTFQNCSGLKSVTWGKGVTSVGQDAFKECKNIERVNISDLKAWLSVDFGISCQSGSLGEGIYRYIQNPLYYAGHLYLNGSELTDIVVPDGIETLWAHAFEGYTAITSLVIPDGVKEFKSRGAADRAMLTNGFSGLSDCPNLKSIKIGAGLKKMQISDCTALTSVEVGDSKIIIEFSKCPLLNESGIKIYNAQEVYIRWCDAITELTLANIDNTTSKFNIYSCSGLKKLQIPDGVSSAYVSDCPELTTLILGLGIQDNYNGLRVSSCKELADVYNPMVTPLKNVANYAFSDDCQIEYATLHVPESALESYKSTEPWSKFGTIVALKEGDPGYANNPPVDGIITFADSRVMKICVDNWDTDGDGKLTEQEAAAVKDLGTVFKSNTQITTFNEFKYFTGVTSIGESAFNGCSKLTSIILPVGVTSIGYLAFGACTSLNEITMPSTLTSIGKSAFSGCSGLTEIVIPDNVRDIGENVFISCQKLASLTLSKGLTRIANYAFMNCPALMIIDIPEGIVEIGDEAFGKGEWYSGEISREQVTIPNSVKKVGMSIFSGTTVKKLFLGTGITEIEAPNNFWGAFEEIHISNLTDWLNLPPCVISDSPFRLYVNDSELRDVTIPEGMKEIFDSRFYNCISITDLNIPSSVSSIGVQAFKGCTGLVSLEFSERITIGRGAFSDCTGITSILLPKNEKDNDIGFSAFKGCSSLKDVFCPITTPISIQDPESTNPFPIGIATLHVPAESVDLYKNAYGWRKFANIVALQEGDPGYEKPNNTVTLTAKSYTRAYGDVNPTFDYTVTGGTITSGTPAITCSATATSPVGTYDIVISKGTVSNSTVNLVKGTLTITKAPLTISAGNYTKKEGENNPTFKATYSGFKNNETEAVLTKKPTITTTATKTSPTGSYPVTVSGAEAQNYAITYQNGTLTVTASGTPSPNAEPYAVLSNDNSVVTFFYDNNKVSRGGIDINNSWIGRSDSSPYGTAKKAVFDASFASYRPISTSYWFHKCSSMTTISGIENLKTDNVTDMGGMFAGCSSLTNLDVSGFKTDKVTIMYDLFSGCSSLTSLDVSGFNTSNVTSMSSMFYGCTSLTNLDVSGFNTSNVKSMRAMFYKLYGLSSLDLSSFKTDKVEDMSFMFYWSSGIETIYVGSEWSTAAVKEGKSMFEDCRKLVGGQGTAYRNAYKDDYTYAHIDGGTANPGYLTDIKAKTEKVTLTAKSYSRIYGDPNPTFEYTVTGGTITSGAPTITCSATATSPVGTYDIVIAKGTVSNSNVELVKGTLTITKAPLTISAGNYTKVEGEDNPTFTPTYSGFKNGETEAVLTKKPIVTCEANKDSEPGSYEIKVSGAKAQNYDISYVSGWLTIEENPNKFEEDDTSYEILDDGTVAITKDWKVQHTQVLPTIVLYDGKSYTVTVIGADAFRNNQNLTQITIPNTITSIGDGAFAGCVNLTVIIIHVENPIDIAKARTRAGGSSVFEGVDKETCILYVPDGSVEAYKIADGWNEFKNILPISALGIDGVYMNGKPFDIYTLQGRKVRHEATSLDGLPKGVYIINGRKVVK